MSEEMSAAEYLASLQQQKGHKYSAERTTVDGITFDSKAEARRYRDLALMADQGVIRDLVLQPRWPLYVNHTKIGTYVGDFQYIDNITGEAVIEDVKGFRTPAYRLKKKLMAAIYGIEITEVEATR